MVIGSVRDSVRRQMQVLVIEFFDPSRTARILSECNSVAVEQLGVLVMGYMMALVRGQTERG